eukprot:2403117-Prymnesium_polylepis.1
MIGPCTRLRAASAADTLACAAAACAAAWVAAMLHDGTPPTLSVRWPPATAASIWPPPASRAWGG